MEKTTYVERVVITLNANGSIRGCHQEINERIIDNGTVIAERLLPASNLNPAVLSALLPDQAALLAQISELQMAPAVEVQPELQPEVQPNIRLLSQAQFRARFTEDELTAFSALVYGGDALAQNLLLKITTASDGIDLDSADVSLGLDYMVARGVLTPIRRDEIVA